MQFSIARLLLITLFVNFVVAATFTFPPLLGVTVLTFVALVVVPPFVVVGAVNTRGLRQSFFLGAMVSGTAHFVLNVYVAVLLLVEFSDGGVNMAQFDDDNWIQYLNGVGFLFGTIGGLSGMATFYFLNLGSKPKLPTTPLVTEPNVASQRPEIYPEKSSLDREAETTLPR